MCIIALKIKKNSFETGKFIGGFENIFFHSAILTYKTIGIDDSFWMQEKIDTIIEGYTDGG